MNYIVFDLEFNQDFSSLKNVNINNKYPFEIIQIGAVKLDYNFNVVDTFNHYVKPSIYSNINPFITELTGITTEQLINEKPFTEVYKNYVDFINDKDSIFCIWGMSDIKEIYKNAEYHHLDVNVLPKMYINIQPYVSINLGMNKKQLMRLSHAVKSLNIQLNYDFHDALNDALYTAEIFKKIYNLSIQPKIYDPTFVPRRIVKPRKVIDYHNLIMQFEKMYERKMTDEEQDIIKLAYKMGKTNQFLK